MKRAKRSDRIEGKTRYCKSQAGGEQQWTWIWIEVVVQDLSKVVINLRACPRSFRIPTPSGTCSGGPVGFWFAGGLLP